MLLSLKAPLTVTSEGARYHNSGYRNYHFCNIERFQTPSLNDKAM